MRLQEKLEILPAVAVKISRFKSKIVTAGRAIRNGLTYSCEFLTASRL